MIRGKYIGGLNSISAEPTPRGIWKETTGSVSFLLCEAGVPHFGSIGMWPDPDWVRLDEGTSLRPDAGGVNSNPVGILTLDGLLPLSLRCETTLKPTGSTQVALDLGSSDSGRSYRSVSTSESIIEIEKPLYSICSMDI